jgi:single-strand DNA-binding protein
MAKSLNRVTLIGNLGKDPEIRTTPSGATVCNFSLATTETYKDKNDTWQEVTDWHNIVIWNRLGEVAGQYLKKGSKVYLEGKLKTRSYEKDGITRYMTEVFVNNMVLLPSGNYQGGSGNYAPAETSEQTSTIGPNLSEHVLGEDDFSDEVPF